MNRYSILAVMCIVTMSDRLQNLLKILAMIIVLHVFSKSGSFFFTVKIDPLFLQEKMESYDYRKIIITNAWQDVDVKQF